MGCIFGELLNHSVFPSVAAYKGSVLICCWQPLFPGDNDIDQLSRIISTLGSISVEAWPVPLRCKPACGALSTRAAQGAAQLPDFGKISFCEAEALLVEQVAQGAAN